MRNPQEAPREPDEQALHEPLVGDRSASRVGPCAGPTRGTLLEPVPPPPRPPLRTQSRRDWVQRRALALTDVTSFCLAYTVAYLAAGAPAMSRQGLLLAAVIPVWVLVSKLLGLYDRDANAIRKSTLDEMPRILQSVAIGGGLVVLLAPAVVGAGLARLQALTFVATLAVSVPVLRTAVRTSLSRRGPPERGLLLGSAALAQKLAERLVDHPEYGVALVGVIHDKRAPRSALQGPVRFMGGIDDFEDACAELRIERVFLGVSDLSDEQLLSLVQVSKQLGLKVSLVPGLFDALGSAVEVDDLDGITVLGMRGLSRTRSSLQLKRAIDWVGAATGLLVLSPLLLVIAVAIKLESRGPVLFVQTRVGRRNKPFRMFKFRTMYAGADALRPSLWHLNEATVPMFKIVKDPRLTGVGRLLRRFSLDELPQLWNVLRGEMSLVGPRPLVPDEDAHVIGPHRARLELTPGLTGPWQVLGHSRVTFSEMLKLDYLYVAEWSLWNDFKLLVRTAPVVVRGRGR